MAALRAGDRVFALDADGETPIVALVVRLDEAVTIEDGPLNYSYDITPVGVRLLRDAEGDLDHLPEVLVTPFEGDARQLAALDSEHRYGWVKDGDRTG